MSNVTDFVVDILNKKNLTNDVLKDHPQIPIIIDILSRKEQHNLLIKNISSSKITLSLLETLASNLNIANASKAFANYAFIYFDIKKYLLHNKTLDNFINFCQNIIAENKLLLLVLNRLENESLQILVKEEKCRLLIVSNEESPDNFETLNFLPLSDNQLLSILQSYKIDLENYHAVSIPNETLKSAITMAKHYLGFFSFDKIFELLDSAAARAHMFEKNELTNSKPVVTIISLSQIISNWTKIPISNLNNNIFQMTKFIDYLKRHILGQDDSITLIANVLQLAFINLFQKKGPLCNFLFVGGPEVGKCHLANIMAEYLFGHKEALLRINLSETYQNISEVKALLPNNQTCNMLSAIRQIPYAILLLENIHQSSSHTLQLFKNIFLSGFAVDANGNHYDFSHAIIIMTTNLGAEKIASLTESPVAHETNKTLDLMQLVLNQDAKVSPVEQQILSINAMSEELFPLLESHFSTTLLQCMHIIPFMPLGYASLEKLIRIKVKAFSAHLFEQLGIELNCAPEVIKFLAHEALWRKANIKPLERLLEQYLYSAVANEILEHIDDKNRPKRMALHLNADGQLLRCEFINSPIYS